jgi:outer membrane protein assembly factor BamB
MDTYLNEENTAFIFPYPIKNVLQLAHCSVVLLSIPDFIQYNENVFCFDNKGKFLWQIETISHVYEDSPYESIRINGATIRLENFDGTLLDVDPLTGKILTVNWTK